MITSKLFALCSRVIIDQRLEDVTLVGLLDEVTATREFPVNLQTSTLIFWSQRTDDIPNDVSIQISASIGDDEIFAKLVPINYREKVKNRLMMTLDGLPLPTGGLLVFKAEYGGETIAETEITINPAPVVDNEGVTIDVNQG